MEMAENTCNAIVFVNIDDVEYSSIPMPKIEKSSDAIIKVLICGICGSDLHPYHGKEQCAFGTAFGHECVGEVIAVGSEVKGITIGARFE
jgi:threonine dehydrogenase-like Zn-dependent dehydrogenase